MIVAPTIHLNGSNAATLREALMTALETTTAARSAIAATAPHQRDYYVQQPDRFREAVEQHVARYRALDTVVDELTNLVIAIDEQEQA
jgi:hypothetical protein